MRKSLVTGAGGFIGAHLAAFLKERGDAVVGVDVKPPEFGPSSADRFVLHDLRREDPALARLFDGADDVWALAADMGGMGYISRHHAAIMRDNVLINVRSLEAAREAKVGRYLFASSACVYPEHLQKSPCALALAESMAIPAEPQDGYGWEKLYAERLCHYYHEEHGLSVRVVRLHNVYGPRGTWQGGREKAPAAICRKVAEAALAGKDAIEIWGDGLQTRSFCYIDDALRGLALVMDSGHVLPLNLGSDEMVSIDGLADVAMGAAGVSLRKNHVEGPQGVRGRNCDPSLCRRVTGFSCRIDLRSGIAKTYPWIREQVAARARLGEAAPRGEAG